MVKMYESPRRDLAKSIGPIAPLPGGVGGGFMGRLLSFFRMHWDHEPRAVPRRRKSADKSDALQTLRAVRRRPAVAKRLECVRLQRRFPKASSDSMAGSVHGTGY